MHQKKLHTRKQLAAFLREERGYPIGKSTLDKLCMPTVNHGTPVAGWWGSRPLYDPDEGVAWAEARLRSTRRADVMPGAVTLAIERKLTSAEPPRAKPMARPERPESPGTCNIETKPFPPTSVTGEDD